jgi:hypothetical protein
MQARQEAFNAANHANFNAPVTVLNNSNFGIIQRAGGPRILRFALKAYFGSHPVTPNRHNWYHCSKEGIPCALPAQPEDCFQPPF